MNSPCGSFVLWGHIIECIHYETKKGKTITLLMDISMMFSLDEQNMYFSIGMPVRAKKTSNALVGSIEVEDGKFSTAKYELWKLTCVAFFLQIDYNLGFYLMLRQTLSKMRCALLFLELVYFVVSISLYWLMGIQAAFEQQWKVTFK